MESYPNTTVRAIPLATDFVKLYSMDETLDNAAMDSLMSVGWVIISTWMDYVPRIPVDTPVVVVPEISFRLARGNDRLIVKADITVEIPDEVVPNIDADTPAEKTGFVPSCTDLWLLRLASIAGYGPGSGGGPGLVAPAERPPFWTVGLDIEQSTHERGGGVPLPHDPIISITISSGGWYDKTCPDVCYCIYAFGYHSEIEIDYERKPIFIKTSSSAEAVAKSYEVISLLSPDFVAIHNGFGFDLKRLAAHSSTNTRLSKMYDRRRLGNSGTGVLCTYPNGTCVIDTMFYIDKYFRRDWVSISLANVGKALDLPPKLEVDDMMVKVSDDYDVTKMLIYNARDSDLHAWVARELKICETMYMLSGNSRSIAWDSVAGNSGIMVLCKVASTAMSMGMKLDMSTTSASDEKDFEGGFVFDPRPGCYKGVIVIDGDSLYGSIMSELGIFVDRCASSSSARGLSEKVGVGLVPGLEALEIGDAVEYKGLIIMRDAKEFMCIVPGPPTVMSMVQNANISDRAYAKKIGDKIRATADKFMTVNGFGFLGSNHGVINSKICAKIITYCARRYLKLMVQASEECGYKVIYGDTDSIFVLTGGKTMAECVSAGAKVKMRIREMSKSTVFRRIGADVKGNYKSIVISAKKKYEGVNWDGSLDTKGLAMVKKDALPIAKYALSRVMDVLNGDDTEFEKNQKLAEIVGKIMFAIQKGKIPIRAQITETRISGQPHYVYCDDNMRKKSLLIGIGIEPKDVGRKWVAMRVGKSINSVLVALGMHNVRQLLFTYEMNKKITRSQLGS